MTTTALRKDIANKKIYISREFDAPVEQVWEAWTDSKLLDEWWAPKPWKARTKSMDFRSGGAWVYAMEGPEGESSWVRAGFQNVVPGKSFEVDDAFTDKDGNIDNEMPRMQWKVNFTPVGNSTKVDIEISFPNPQDLDRILEMGFQEGFTAAQENLDELLARR